MPRSNGMEVDDDPRIVTQTQNALLEVARSTHERPLDYGVIPRSAFYERAHGVYAVVHTLDPVPYSCFILQKGVVLT